MNIMLNRSDLDGLGKITGTIYVTGHKSPDSDTVGSSIAYAYLLCELGYDAQPVVLGQINNETKYILNAAGLETPMVLQKTAGCNMVLVDHSEYTQSRYLWQRLQAQPSAMVTVPNIRRMGAVTSIIQNCNFNRKPLY